MAEPSSTTAEPRQIVEPETTTTTSTTTTTEPPPPPVAEVHVLGSVRAIPTPAAEEPVDSDINSDSETVETTVPGDTAPSAPILAEGDATVASLGCTRTTGCEPTDLATWAANTLDVANLATAAAGIDGVEVLDEHVSALVTAGVATVGYGPTLNAALQPAIVGDPELPVAVYAVTLADGLAPDLIATDTTAGIAGGEQALLELADTISTISDDVRVVVLVDFGRLEDRAPPVEVTEQVVVLADVGADAVVVHGSDFLQRFERIGETSVAFGLGNAITTSAEPLRRDSAILRLVYEEEAQNACLFPATATETGVGMDNPTLTECP